MSKNPFLCFKIKYFLLPHKYNFYVFYFEKLNMDRKWNLPFPFAWNLLALWHQEAMVILWKLYPDKSCSTFLLQNFYEE